MSAKFKTIQTFCFVNMNNALTTEQFGFHPSHSAVSALLSFTNDTIYLDKQRIRVLFPCFKDPFMTELCLCYLVYGGEGLLGKF